MLSLEPFDRIVIKVDYLVVAISMDGFTLTFDSLGFVG